MTNANPKWSGIRPLSSVYVLRGLSGMRFSVLSVIREWFTRPMGASVRLELCLMGLHVGCRIKLGAKMWLMPRGMALIVSVCLAIVRSMDDVYVLVWK